MPEKFFIKIFFAVTRLSPAVNDAHEFAANTLGKRWHKWC
jgi:hypothetical protein